MEFWIWLIIVVIMAISKGFEKLAEASRQSPAGAETSSPQPKAPRRERSPHARQPQRQRVSPPVLPPSTRSQTASAVRETPEPARPAAAAPTTPMTDVEPPRRSERDALWAGMLRDRQTLRRLVLAREILGPPRSLREYEQSGWQLG